MPVWTYLLTLVTMLSVLSLALLALTGPGPRPGSGTGSRGRHARRAARANPTHAVTPAWFLLDPVDDPDDPRTRTASFTGARRASRLTPPAPAPDGLTHRERSTALARAGDLPAAAAEWWAAELEALGFDPSAVIATRTITSADTPAAHEPGDADDDAPLLIDRGRRLLTSLAGPSTRGRSLYVGVTSRLTATSADK